MDELAAIAGGKLNHSPEREISGAASISHAVADQITFVTSANHFQAFLDSDAAAAVVCKGLGASPKPVIEVEDPESAFFEIAILYRNPIVRQSTVETQISSRATVSPTAMIGKDVVIHAGAVIMDNVTIGDRTTIFPNSVILEGCSIGNDVSIFPNATLYENTIVGNRVLIHAGAVVGAYGFGYKTRNGHHQLSAQIGNVVLEDDVELGANTTVDRGTYDSTTIGAGSKLDNLVMVGHNCDIGKHNLLCSQVGIAGSCSTGQYVVMGGQVGVGDHLKIGDSSMITAKSGLMHDVEPGQRMMGTPARTSRTQMQLFASSAKLPQMRKEIKALKKQMASVQQLLTDSTAESSAPQHHNHRDAA
jgi:UDP-3-O-[3-hydroxymyristoyl] glucosamine N-acyltransferase